jgi:hypothetical protein
MHYYQQLLWWQHFVAQANDKAFQRALNWSKDKATINPEDPPRVDLTEAKQDLHNRAYKVSHCEAFVITLRHCLRPFYAPANVMSHTKVKETTFDADFVLSLAV